MSADTAWEGESAELLLVDYISKHKAMSNARRSSRDAMTMLEKMEEIAEVEEAESSDNVSDVGRGDQQPRYRDNEILYNSSNLLDDDGDSSSGPDILYDDGNGLVGSKRGGSVEAQVVSEDDEPDDDANDDHAMMLSGGAGQSSQQSLGASVTHGPLDPLYENPNQMYGYEETLPPNRAYEGEPSEDFSQIFFGSHANSSLHDSALSRDSGSLNTFFTNVAERDGSARQNKRSSFASTTELSQNSALTAPPAPVQEHRRSITGEPRPLRRVTISVPKDDPQEYGGSGPGGGGGPLDGSGRQASQRRLVHRHRGSTRASRNSFVGRSSFTTPGSGAVAEESEGGGSAVSRGSIMKSIRSRTTVFAPSRASHVSNRRSTTTSGDGSGQLNISEAVDRLGSHTRNSEWENAAAAAAVVAATTNAPVARKHVQFGQDDFVLVMLTLLNITNRVDEEDMFTVDPVNSFGYPSGGGKTDEERQGPYSFVLCTVKKVHFDEDERYYTIQRHDTGSEQRSDPPWMEAIRDSLGIEAAMKAAKRTQRSEAASTRKRRDGSGFASCMSNTFTWPMRFLQDNIIPFYRKARGATKVAAAKLLTGSPGYAFRIRVTGINILVLCSFIFLFVDSFSIAFLPASTDRASAVVAVVVWIVLATELLFEYLIRPKDYHEINESEKAFSPTTARHINAFHLTCEVLALLLFIPHFPCAFAGETCGTRVAVGPVEAALNAVISPSNGMAAYGRFILGLTFLRTFGLARHWKQMWINMTFEEASGHRHPMVRRLLLIGRDPGGKPSLLFRKTKTQDDTEVTMDDEDPSSAMDESNEADQQLKNAAHIGTALMLVNSHRALVIALFIVTVFPMIYSIGRTNSFAPRSIDLLQSNNLSANSTSDCDYLRQALHAWLRGTGGEQTKYSFSSGLGENPFILWAQVLPSRCPWQQADGVITLCDLNATTCELQDEAFGVSSCGVNYTSCFVWNHTMPDDPAAASPAYFASLLGVRAGGIIEFTRRAVAQSDFDNQSSTSEFSVRVLMDENHTLAFTMSSLFILLFLMLLLTLVGLTVMRGDAGRLVLNPLRSMLKIVVRYAENPLSQDATGSKSKQRHDGDDDNPSGGGDKEQLGNYETEQLITAISKITDLLRKCWGVAGAIIISTNLARTTDGRTVAFNPTVPGKRVYALFGFVAVNDFSKLLRDLDNDVMILINDVARVVHDEVYRWALGESGQCNKNLGPAFLMVFRIGDFSDVHAKKKRATDVVFSSHQAKNAKVRQRSTAKKGSASSKKNSRRPSSRHFDIKNDGTLQLASLPGIQSFTDRALLGFLKSFAGIHRDRKLQNWKKDFRFGGGVGAFTASVIYGMDAGWAVEGAVGSEYKIDATYLSPHVNMASRMMSATKQYGITILLSQAVEELLSRPARDKLRHLDTVYVKGSSVAQRIFTYDARYQGVDFFLFARSNEQADMEAESYSQVIWDVDQDLRSMRQHVTDGFMDKFKAGVDQYLEGNWKNAVQTLNDADNLMIQAIVEEGYIELDDSDVEAELYNSQSCDEEVMQLRNELGDGACKCLVQYMQKRNCVPPSDWVGVRHLMSK